MVAYTTRNIRQVVTGDSSALSVRYTHTAENFPHYSTFNSVSSIDHSSYCSFFFFLNNPPPPELSPLPPHAPLPIGPAAPRHCQRSHESRFFLSRARARVRSGGALSSGSRHI